MAKRVLVLDDELASNRAEITRLVETQASELLDLPHVGAITAAIVLSVWSHPGRIRGQAAFTQIAGTCPIPASSGNTVPHRFNCGGDRRLNRASNTVVLTRIRTDPTTRVYIQRQRVLGAGADPGPQRNGLIRSMSTVGIAVPLVWPIQACLVDRSRA